MTTCRGFEERRRVREERQRRAVEAVVAHARENGLRVEEPTVLNDLFSLVVHLKPAPVVARVATCMPKHREEWIGLQKITPAGSDGAGNRLQPLFVRVKQSEKSRRCPKRGLGGPRSSTSRLF